MLPNQLKLLDSFKALFETSEHVCSSIVYVVNKQRAGNLLGIETIEQLKLIKVVHNIRKQTSQINVEEKNVLPIIPIEVKKLLNEYDEIFHGNGIMKDYECKLHTKPEITPIYQKMRRSPIHLHDKIDNEIVRLEEVGIIESVTGPQEWVSNLVATPKSNGSVRLCLDARSINTAIKRETHPIPTIESVVEDMHEATIFSKIDMTEAYTQIVLEEESRKLTNFHTSFGIKRFKRLCYGINNAFEIFQRALDQTIGKLPNVKCISDDIIVYNKNKHEHIKTLKVLFEKIKELGLRLNRKKCVFMKTSISFFGIIISSDGVRPDPEKIASIVNASQPSNINELRSFLGLSTYLSKFIEHFSSKTEPLRKLLKKNTKFKWSNEQQKAFDVIKKSLVSDNVLAHYNPNLETELITDASNFGIGGVLLQTDTNDNQRPISYISKSLTDTEKRYGITEKEALAVVWCIERYHYYLYGKSFKLTVDHKPLQFIFKPQARLSSRISRWQLKLQAYDFEINYVKGEKNIADFLSRKPMKSEPSKNDQTREYVNFTIKHSTPISLNIHEIREASKNDSTIQSISQALKTGKWDDAKEYKAIKDELCESENIILRENRILLPKAFHEKVIEIAHRGHLGMEKVKQIIRSKIYWKGMNDDIKRALSHCEACQAVRPPIAPTPLKPSPLPEQPWEEIAIDIFGPLPSGEKLLVIIDLYSRFPIIEIVKTTTTNVIINKLENIFCVFGFPKKLRMDNGPPFNSNDFKTYLQSCDIKKKSITPYYPQANGTVERFMRVIKKTIHTAFYQNKNWRNELNRMLLNYRTAPHAVTGKAPSYLLFNRTINNNIPHINDEKHEADEFVRRKQNKVNNKTKQWFDKKKKATDINLNIHDTVIMKREMYADKTKSNFYNQHFKVLKINHNMVTVQNSEGKIYTRNHTYFKKVNADKSKTKPFEHSIEKKKYPSRQRKRVSKFVNS